jgi:hypothetical protein
LTIVALIAASPAFAARCPPGQFYRVRLDECVSLNSSSRAHTSPPRMSTKKIDTPPEAGPPVAADPLTADPHPDE